MPEPFAVLANHRRLFFTSAAHEAAAHRAANALPPTLSDLAVYRVASTIGCSWCVGFGTMMHRLAGLDVDQLTHIAAYATSPQYSDDERAVISYAEAITATPPEVTDEQVTDLRRRLGDAAVVELTYQIAHENMGSPMNSALRNLRARLQHRRGLPGAMGGHHHRHSAVLTKFWLLRARTEDR